MLPVGMLHVLCPVMKLTAVQGWPDCAYAGCGKIVHYTILIVS